MKLKSIILLSVLLLTGCEAKQNNPNLVCQVPKSSEEAAAKLYSEIYNKTLINTSSGYAKDSAENAVKTVYGKYYLILTNGFVPVGTNGFVKPED